MKLFHTENGKEVVYVQRHDLVQLELSEMLIPASIYTKVFTGRTIVDDSNRFDFVRFDEEHEVKFFRELEFVIDYDQYKDLTDEQLDEEAQKLATKANKIAEKWNSMSIDERKQNSNLLQEHENVVYMLNFLFEIYAVKHGKRYMPFPDFVKPPENPKKMWNEERCSAYGRASFKYINNLHRMLFRTDTSNLTTIENASTQIFNGKMVVYLTGTWLNPSDGDSCPDAEFIVINNDVTLEVETEGF